MCTCENNLNSEWTYYLVEWNPSDMTEVMFAWIFRDRHEALMKMKDEAFAHADRAYQIFKSID